MFYQNAETRDSSDTLTSSCQTTRRHIPEDGSPHGCRFRDLKIHVRAIIVMRSLLLSLFHRFAALPYSCYSSFPIFYAFSYIFFKSRSSSPFYKFFTSAHSSFFSRPTVSYFSASISSAPFSSSVSSSSAPVFSVLRFYYCFLYFPHSVSPSLSLFLSSPNFLLFFGTLIFSSRPTSCPFFQLFLFYLQSSLMYSFSVL